VADSSFEKRKKEEEIEKQTKTKTLLFKFIAA